MENYPKKLILGTRGSPLALVQAEAVVSKLKRKFPKISIHIEKIKTSGDRFRGKHLATAGGKGLFVKELEEALRKGEIDIAVHSLKDVPGSLPADLEMACYFNSEDPRDGLVSKKYRSFEEIPKGAVIGTSSPRRRAQLLFLKQDCRVEPIRGNITTRLKKLEEDRFDAIVMAAAGLKRLKLEKAITEYLDPRTFIPAVGQGVSGIEIRKRDRELSQWSLEPLQDPQTVVTTVAERAFLKAIGGDCQTALGAFAWVIGNQLRIVGFLGTPDGKTILRLERDEGVEKAAALGQELAKAVLMIGGKEILRASSTH